MSDPITGIAGIFAGKKAALFAIPFIGVITNSEASAVTIDIIKNWAVVVAIVAGSIYMGKIFYQVEEFKIQAEKDRRQIMIDIQHEFKLRDFKLEFVYAQATRGDRFTAADGKALRQELLENSAEDNTRHHDILDATSLCRSRIERLENTIVEHIELQEDKK